MTGIFISYRGDDSLTTADLIYRHLTDRFGSDQVFLDRQSIPAGMDFVDELLGRIRTCSVLLVVIGPHWLTFTGKGDRRRIDDPGTGSGERSSLRSGMGCGSFRCYWTV